MPHDTRWAWLFTRSRALTLLVILAAQLGLLAPWREFHSDELIIADSAYTLAHSTIPIPRLPIWSAIIPAFDTINLHYGPLYLYTLGLFYQIAGFSPTTTGLLHLLIRTASGLLCWSFARRLALPPARAALVTLLWVTLVRGIPGRPDDLTYLLLLAGLVVMLRPEQGLLQAGVAGIGLGLAFLTHPSALLAGAPLFGALLLTRWPRSGRRSALLIFTCTLALTMAVWLFWIVPYWSAFRAIMGGFVIPSSAADSYLGELRDFVGLAVSGEWEFGGRYFQYSLVPSLLLLLILVAPALWSGPWRQRGATAALLLGPLGVFPLIFAHNDLYWAPFRWFNLLLVIAILLALGGAATPAATPRRGRWAIGLLSALIVVQAGASMLTSLTPLLGDAALAQTCVGAPYQPALASIGEGEPVATNVGVVFYQLRGTHPVRWPAGPGEHYYGNPPVVYPSDLRWVVVARPIGMTSGGDPGKLFAWTAASYGWFDAHYTLYRVSRLADVCALRRFSRYAHLPPVLYIYERNAGT